MLNTIQSSIITDLKYDIEKWKADIYKQNLTVLNNKFQMNASGIVNISHETFKR